LKKYVYLVFSILLISMIAAGCTGLNNSNNGSQASLTHSAQAYKDVAWAQNVTETTGILKNDTSKVSKAIDDSDWYTVFTDLEKYKLDLKNAVTSSDSFIVSPELQPCKDEYRLGLIDDYDQAVLSNTSISLLVSGDFKDATNTTYLIAEKAKSAEGHYNNVTYLLNSYNKGHQPAPLNVSTLHHNVTQEENQSTVNTLGKGSFKNPAMKGETIVLTSTGKTYNFSVSDSKRGDQANYIVKKANEFNENPASGYEYLLVKTKISYTKGDGSENLDNTELKVFCDGVECTRSYAVLPSDYIEFNSGDVMPGATKEGWGVYIVPIGKEAIFSFQPNMFDESTAYISLGK
jgi:hypothetical protein